VHGGQVDNKLVAHHYASYHDNQVNVIMDSKQLRFENWLDFTAVRDILKRILQWQIKTKRLLTGKISDGMRG
jgi:hypothetical protein